MFPAENRQCSPGMVLLLACRAGDRSKVATLLKSGVNATNVRDARGRATLHLAAEHGHLDVTKCLLKAGVSTECKTPIDDHTPLRIAAENGHASVVAALLRAGANPHARDSLDRATPLHAAAEKGHISVINRLVNHDTSCLEKRAASGQTPLRWAVSCGQTAAICALLSAGADPNAPDKWGASCLHAIAAVGESECCMILDTASSITSILLASGADPNYHQKPAPLTRSRTEPHSSYRHNLGETPLHVGARESSVEVVAALLRAGADPSARRSSGEDNYTPLHCAAAPGCARRRRVVRLLLEAGAEVDSLAHHSSTERSLMTPLSLACLNCAVSCVEELLRWGASMNLQDRPLPSLSERGIPLCFTAEHPILDHALPNTPVPAGSEGQQSNIAVPDNAETRLLSHRSSSSLEALVGCWVPSAIKDEDDFDRIRVLLRRAPAEMAWRRRGWLLLLNARWEAARGTRGSMTYPSATRSVGANLARTSTVERQTRQGPPMTKSPSHTGFLTEASPCCLASQAIVASKELTFDSMGGTLNKGQRRFAFGHEIRDLFDNVPEKNQKRRNTLAIVRLAPGKKRGGICARNSMLQNIVESLFNIHGDESILRHVIKYL